MRNRLVMAYSGKVKDLQRLLRAKGEDPVVQTTGQGDVNRTIYVPADKCPGCGRSLYGKYMEVLCYHLGREHGGWTLYHCLHCGLTFRAYTRWMTAKETRKLALEARGYYFEEG